VAIWIGPGILKGNGVVLKPGDPIPDGVVPDDVLETLKASGKVEAPEAKPKKAKPAAKKPAEKPAAKEAPKKKKGSKDAKRKK